MKRTPAALLRASEWLAAIALIGLIAAVVFALRFGWSIKIAIIPACIAGVAVYLNQRANDRKILTRIQIKTVPNAAVEVFKKTAAGFPPT